MPDREPDEEPQRRDAAVRAWLVSADADLASAEVLRKHRDERVGAFTAALHAQQAAEKATKALLLRHGTEFPPTHDLALLLDRIPNTPAGELAGRRPRRQ